jgi:transposase
MIEPSEMPDDLAACQALIRAQAALLSQYAAAVSEHAATIAEQARKIAEQARKIEELGLEMEKVRKLLSHFVNGHRSEKRILSGADQAWLPFENSEEFQAARAEAEAQAATVIQTYTVQREVAKKKPRDESLPAHLRREEQLVAGDAAQQHCPTHGARTIIGYNTTETLVYTRPELHVRVKKYPKYACSGHPACGIESPPRPTSLVEGERYDTSVAATIVEAKWFHHLPIYRHQDQFAGSGWTPSRSTLLNIVSQVEFVVSPLIAFMARQVQQDIGIGLDETSCRMLLPHAAAACCCRQRSRK